MSIDIFVVSENQLPEPTEWQSSLTSESSELQLPGTFSFREFEGYLPFHHEGREYGFEYLYGTKVSADFNQQHNTEIKEEDHLVLISVPAGSPEDRVQMAKIAAASLAEKSEGEVYMSAGRLNLEQVLEEFNH